MLFSRLGDSEQAIKNLEIAVKEEPNYWKTHYQLALAYQRVGNEEKAKAYMESYLRLFKEITGREAESEVLGDKSQQEEKIGK